MHCSYHPFSVHCCVHLDQQGKCNHQFFLMQFIQAASLFNSPEPRGTSIFIHSSHNHASTNHHRSHHPTRQACSANQGLRASHPPNMGLFTAWHRFLSGAILGCGPGWPESPEWLPTAHLWTVIFVRLYGCRVSCYYETESYSKVPYHLALTIFLLTPLPQCLLSLRCMSIL